MRQDKLILYQPEWRLAYMMYEPVHRKTCSVDTATDPQSPSYKGLYDSIVF